MSFVNELREDMSRHGLTASSVARGARVNRKTVSRWLSGKAEPHRSTMERYRTYIRLRDHSDDPALHDAANDMDDEQRDYLFLALEYDHWDNDD